MNSNKKTGRITGVLLLFVFISGIIIFQFLQGPILFSDNFLTSTSENSNKIIGSVVLGIFSGIVSIVVAIVLLPIFKKHNMLLAYLYFAFCILNFIAIMIDNVSVISMLELSKEYVGNESNNSLNILETLIYKKHFWTHYFYLLISCFPVFVLYYMFFLSKLLPRIISIFGIIAVILMFIEELSSIFGHSISMNMLLPIGIIQLILPFWLIFKGMNSSTLKNKII
ncbi:DUF4386 domain-containing protein [Tenacibaculum sp. E3R01]|uniref:DUF4386 domain-containing protein n=1 Tax=Tenacibaculum sp. E3R01 TaxID=2267227 RepID=UPI000DEB64C8|nr:DUF4386 domain-containing protein [Tenacibaculum sp. E3R01]RBW55841.1 DUF4386 domain-containing protein [Tenacibaculum sp. E3R01]